MDHQRRRARLLLLLLSAAIPSTRTLAQFDLEDSHTKASLRGIHSLGDGIAWASGTDGTVLRTKDGGYLWQGCAIPPGAEHLDFRSIQASDENTAVVMSSGKGDLSRLYKTTDGCRTWRLLFTNPDKEGFWDAIVGAPDPRSGSPGDYSGTVLGDPVNGSFTLLYVSVIHFEQAPHSSITKKSLMGSDPPKSPEPPPFPNESAFAASNSSFVRLPRDHSGWIFGTGGASEQPRVIGSFCDLRGDYFQCRTKISPVPMAYGATGGIFSLASREFFDRCRTDQQQHELLEKTKPSYWPPIGPQCQSNIAMVAVGGDYAKPDQTRGTAAYFVETAVGTTTDPQTWTAAQTPPHGYRSSVAYDPKSKAWITVGPNGSDYSTDDGKNWHPLKPGPNQPPDTDKNWNALSLPFVVGPHGRIGKLRSDALAAGSKP